VRRLTGPNTSFVAWNADGSRILVSVLTPNTASFGTSRLVDPQTGEGRDVLPSTGALLGGSWSRGRPFYAAVSVDPVSRAQGVVIVDGSFGRVRRSVRFGSLYAWSPRAQVLAVATASDVRMIDAATGRVLAVIPAHTPRGLSVTALRWAPDGRSLLIAALPTALFHD
jgi:hypothetical protein